MALKIGNNAVANAFVGSSQVRRAYKGGTLVYQGFSPASEQEFIEQTAAGGPAKLLKVYGKSVVWNQLVTNRDFSSGTTNWDAVRGTLSVVDNVATLVANGAGAAMLRHTSVFARYGSHKYYVKVSLTAAQACRVRNGNVDAASLNYFQMTANVPSVITEIYKPAVNTDAMTQYTLIMQGVSGGAPSAGDSIDVRYVDIIDLTLLYGAGNEPTSVEQFEADYPTYDPTYDPGSIQSNKTSLLRAERIPVINMWDEEWEVGEYSESTGQKSTTNDRIRSANMMQVTPNASYYIKYGGTGNYIYIFEYDAAKTYLGTRRICATNNAFTTSANAYYINFTTYPAYGTTYNHDICINLSDPAINGQYYSHWRGSLALNLSTLTGKLNGEGASVVVYPDGLRGVGSIRDEAEGSTGVVRFGKRAYQAGDESDTSVLTDGTNTIYPLATPLTYTLDTPLPTDLTCEQGDILQRVSDNNCPFVGEMRFGL